MLQDPDLSTWRPSPASQAWVNQVSCSTPILPASVVTWSLIPLFPSLDCKLLEGKGLAIFILIESNLILSLAQLNLSTCLTKKTLTWGCGMSLIGWQRSQVLGYITVHVCTCAIIVHFFQHLPFLVSSWSSPLCFVEWPEWVWEHIISVSLSDSVRDILEYQKTIQALKFDRSGLEFQFLTQLLTLSKLLNPSVSNFSHLLCEILIPTS